MEAIIIAAIGATATIITAMLGRKGIQKQADRADKAEREMLFQRHALDFDGFFQEWGELQEELKTLCEETPIDRFLLLRAFNGVDNPEWTNAVYQFRHGDQHPFSYIHVSLDDDYASRLKQVCKSGFIHLTTKDMESGLMKDIYCNEGVTDALWFHIASYDMVDSGCRMIAYCSFSTHGEEEICPKVIVRCRLIANRFRRIADSLASNRELAKSI